MSFARRRMPARRAVVAVASGLLLTGVAVCAGPVAAAVEVPPQQDGGATATLDRLRTYDQALISKDGETRRTGAGLFEMTVDDGGTFQTYCVDSDNPTQEEARYQEVPWATSSLHGNKNAGKIRWILEHSYPQVNDLQMLADQSGARGLTPRTAAAGTQVAIWRYSDRGQVRAVDSSAEKLADYLQRTARTMAEPKESLSLSPENVSGKAGGLLGPVTVRTTEQSVGVAPAPEAASLGVKVVDKAGKAVDTARNGTRLYLDVPEKIRPGETSLTVQASTKVPVGRAFAGVGEHARSQTQILAGSSRSMVSATATVNWADGGAIPAVTAEKNCAGDSVDVTVANGGDEPFAFRLAGERHEVGGGRTEKIAVPVQEDQPYLITVRGPHGFEKTFSGVLDCATASATASAANGRSEAGLTPQSVQPAAVGGGSGSGGQGGTDDGADLAQTGDSGNTPSIVGIALGLVAVGAVTLLAVRRRPPETPGAPGPGFHGGE